MHNDLFLNKNDISQEDFNVMIKSNNLEIFHKEQYDSYFNSMESLFEKSDFDELNDLEKSQLDLFKSNMESLTKWIVNTWDDEKSMVVKSVQFTREKQIEWDKDEDGKLLKGISGTYLDTEINKSLNRVGEKFVNKTEDSK